MQVAENRYVYYDRHPFVPLLCGRPGTVFFFTGGPYEPGCGPEPALDHDQRP